MSNHKFRVGQMVDLIPARIEIATQIQGYKILRLLPQEGGECLYQIKTTKETFERVAKEGELLLRGLPD